MVLFLMGEFDSYFFLIHAQIFSNFPTNIYVFFSFKKPQRGLKLGRLVA